MKPYDKIRNVFQRDAETHKLIEGAWSWPEFEYLKGCEWEATEKIDGTNVRLIWAADENDQCIEIRGRTDDAQLHPELLSALANVTTPDMMREVFSTGPVCLYGEGYGPKVNRGGKYRPNHGFALFDVWVGGWWLKPEDVLDVAKQLEIEHVPVITGRAPLHFLIDLVRGGMCSTYGDFQAEGLVCRPTVQLFNRQGYRVITKIKTKDF